MQPRRHQTATMPTAMAISVDLIAPLYDINEMHLVDKRGCKQREMRMEEQ